MVASLLSTIGRSEKLMLKGKSSTFVARDLSNEDSGLSQNSHIRPTDETDIRQSTFFLAWALSRHCSRMPGVLLLWQSRQLGLLGKPGTSNCNQRQQQKTEKSHRAHGNLARQHSYCNHILSYSRACG